MALFGGVWLCYGSDLPRKVGAEIYYDRGHLFGASVSLWFGYVGVEWRR